MQMQASVSNFLPGHKVDIFVNNSLDLLKPSSFFEWNYKRSSIDFRNLELTEAGREKVI